MVARGIRDKLIQCSLVQHYNTDKADTTGKISGWVLGENIPVLRVEGTLGSELKELRNYAFVLQ